MKIFNDYFLGFTQFVRNLEGHPKFNNCIFNYVDTHKNTYKYNPDGFEYRRLKQDKAEIIYNKLLEDGCSWINIVATQIHRKTLYVNIENSGNFHSSFVGKTDVKFTAVLYGDVYCLKFYWNLSFFERLKYRKQLKYL
jgi:hypothetical protein